LLEPFKSQEISEVEDGTLVIRAKFKAKAGKQTMIRRAALTAVHRAFQENGIKPCRNRLLQVLTRHRPPEFRNCHSILNRLPLRGPVVLARLKIVKETRCACAAAVKMARLSFFSALSHEVR
jgi:hypothetical protein